MSILLSILKTINCYHDNNIYIAARVWVVKWYSRVYVCVWCFFASFLSLSVSCTHSLISSLSPSLLTIYYDVFIYRIQYALWLLQCSSHDFHVRFRDRTRFRPRWNPSCVVPRCKIPMHNITRRIMARAGSTEMHLLRLSVRTWH